MKRIDDIRELHDEICEAYLKDPNFCPYCEADEIDAERVDVEGRVAWQWVRCDTCGAEWHDIFELRAIEKVELPHA